MKNRHFWKYAFCAFLSICCNCIAQESINDTTDSKPFFGASENQPYHLSIGAVLFNQEGLIACHHFKDFLGHKDIYILMRETMENNETPLMTLHRGLKEEFGATAHPLAFLGCLSGYLPDSSLSFEKTTLYIVCKVIDWNPEDRDLNDPEACSTIEWLEPSILIPIMEQQGIRYAHRADADESEMVKRALFYIGGNCKTHLPVKLALLKPIAPIFPTQPTRGWPRQMDRGSNAATRNRPQNHRFFRAKQFCNSLIDQTF